MTGQTPRRSVFDQMWREKVEAQMGADYWDRCRGAREQANESIGVLMAKFGESFADARQAAVSKADDPDVLKCVVWTRKRVYGYSIERGAFSLPLYPQGGLEEVEIGD